MYDDRHQNHCNPRVGAVTGKLWGAGNVLSLNLSGG